MLRIVITILLCSFCSSKLVAQLRFPVKNGYVEERRTFSARCGGPVNEIQIEGRSKNVRACEPGWVLSVFEVEGDKYILVKGEYFIAYGPFARVNAKRMDSISPGKRLGKLAVDKGERKYLDLLILKDANKKVSLDTIFPAYGRKR